MRHCDALKTQQATWLMTIRLKQRRGVLSADVCVPAARSAIRGPVPYPQGCAKIG